MKGSERKEWLQEQISAAIAGEPSEYVINSDGNYVFTLPDVGTKYTICCVANPTEFKNQRLTEFSQKIQKAKFGR